MQGYNKGNDKGNGHGERERNDELTGVPVRMSRGKNEQTMVTVAAKTGTTTSEAERHVASSLGTL